MFVMLRNGTKDISTGEPETRVWYSRFLLRATDVHPDHLPAGVQLRAEEIWVRLESVLFYPPPHHSQSTQPRIRTYFQPSVVLQFSQ